MNDEKDWLTEVHARQAKMADAIAAGLVELLDAALWFPLAVTEEVDADTARIFVIKELEHQVHKAIEGYTDWVACGIVRSKRFGERRLPMPGAYAGDIARKYDIKVPVLEYVAERLAKQDVLPLLGPVRDGVLIPDKKALKEWAKFYDWSSRESGGA